MSDDLGPRHYPDWINAFMDYTSHTEAPSHMRFWVGVSAIAGALRRKVWFEQGFFKWYPSFYIILVAPPGVVSKTTTAGLSMELLKQVPDIKFGPDVVTWQSLVQKFAESREDFLHEGSYHPMCALTLSSGEFGNLVDPNDPGMVNLLIELWDSRQGEFTKATKASGSDQIINPWINLIACTTPSWIAGNFPEYMIGGGFTSRAIFVYADKKAKYVPYPGKNLPADLDPIRQALVHDLTIIAQKLSGEYRISAEAEAWGRQWYEQHNQSRPANLDNDKFGGYLARKQAHIHKLAMVIAASKGDRMVIELDHIVSAYAMVTELEPDMQFVFSKIGRTESSLHTEKLIEFVHAGPPVGVPFMECYRHVHAYFPKMRDFEEILAGCVKSGFIQVAGGGATTRLLPGVALPQSTQRGEIKV